MTHVVVGPLAKLFALGGFGILALFAVVVLIVLGVGAAVAVCDKFCALCGRK